MFGCRKQRHGIHFACFKLPGSHISGKPFPTNQVMLIKRSKKDIFEYKIAYISDQRFPVRNATSEQVINTVSALASEGVDIALIIPRKWEKFSASKKLLKEELMNFYTVNNGFDICRLIHLPLPVKSEKVSHGLIAPVFANFTNHEIVYTRNFLPALLSVRIGKKVIFETFHVFDLFRTNIVKHLARLSHSPNFLSIITHSIPSKESLINAGVVGEKVKVIHNGFNSESLRPRLTKTDARRKLGWNENEKIVCYAGRIDADKGINTILDLAERTPEIKYVLIGYSEKNPDNWILNSASEKGVKNIDWFPWTKTNELAKFLFASDVLIIPPTATPLSKFGRTVLPMKTFIYMAVGRCILAPSLPDTADVLNEQNTALVEPDNLDLVTATIRRVFKDDAWRNSLEKQAQLDSKNYTWQSRAKKIIAWTNECLSRVK